MFSRTLPVKRTVSWSTIATCARSHSSAQSRASRPSISTRPATGSWKRAMSAPSVDLPAPEGPTTATHSPGRDVQGHVAQDGPLAP